MTRVAIRVPTRGARILFNTAIVLGLASAAGLIAIMVLLAIGIDETGRALFEFRAVINGIGEP